MYEQLKISQHHHSGRLRPHEHTSYIPLFLMVFLVGIILVVFSVSSYVTAASPGPQAGSVGLTGAMPAVPPKIAATIDVPNDQQHFSFSPVKVSGTCPLGTLVEIFKNNIFGGSSQCNEAGNYTLDVDLLYGQNILTAQVFDSLNQAGPLSRPVTVFYDASLPIAANLAFLNFGGGQLLLISDPVYRGTFPNEKLSVPLSILGGVAPFAVNIQWGDSTNTVIPRSDNSVFNATHVYKKAGIYKITFQATDAQQQSAFLTVAAIVNGSPVGGAAGTINETSSKTEVTNKLVVLWPLYAILITMVISFWLGEKREKRIMQKLGYGVQRPTLGSTPQPSV